MDKITKKAYEQELELVELDMEVLTKDHQRNLRALQIQIENLKNLIKDIK